MWWVLRSPYAVHAVIYLISNLSMMESCLDAAWPGGLCSAWSLLGCCCVLVLRCGQWLGILLPCYCSTQVLLAYQVLPKTLNLNPKT